jgi:hypothetical protein
MKVMFRKETPLLMGINLDMVCPEVNAMYAWTNLISPLGLYLAPL